MGGANFGLYKTFFHVEAFLRTDTNQYCFFASSPYNAAPPFYTAHNIAHCTVFHRHLGIAIQRTSWHWQYRVKAWLRPSGGADC